MKTKPAPPQKICVYCKQVLPSTRFARSDNYADGVRPWCRECAKNYGSTGGWHHENADWKKKTCPVCGGVFTPKSGVHKFCSPQCKGEWKYIDESVTTESQYAAINGDWARYASRLLYSAGRKRDGLTREIILQKLAAQDYKCALSGMPLTCYLEKGKKSRTNASVDRITPGAAYTADNIQIVCNAVNMWRSDLTVEEFVSWCRHVVNHADNRGDDDGEASQELSR